MAQTGIKRIDDLFAGNPAAVPLAKGDPDEAAVGVLQDLLIGHGARLPGIVGTDHGTFGPRTEAALKAFQAQHDCRINGQLDTEALGALVSVKAQFPIAAQGYLTLVLGLPWTGFTRLVALTAQFEAAGKFTACNRNTDGAGLSFGIIQWAQKPGRLNGLLRAFERAQPAEFVKLFGNGDQDLADGLMLHTAKPKGGVNPLGHTTDPRFDLTNDIWSQRFVAAGRDRAWQKTQIAEAIAAYRESYLVIRTCVPTAKSERALAFMLDLANQHGNGGLRNICLKCTSSGMTEAALLQATQDESVRRLKAQFGDGSNEAASTLNRRTCFRTSALLSDDVFEDAQPGVPLSV
jgi:peptidoglycan hydrolase-like protein with peptidoglycan-binding domain